MDPMERLKTLSVLQGGGVLVLNGQVTFTSTNIYDNLAYDVRARLSAPDPWPHGSPAEKQAPFLCAGWRRASRKWPSDFHVD